MLIWGQDELNLQPFSCVAPASAGQPAQCCTVSCVGNIFVVSLCSAVSEFIKKLFIFSTKTEVLTH